MLLASSRGCFWTKTNPYSGGGPIGLTKESYSQGKRDHVPEASSSQLPASAIPTLDDNPDNRLDWGD